VPRPSMASVSKIDASSISKFCHPVANLRSRIGGGRLAAHPNAAPPRDAGMPRSSRPAAMARSDSQPAVSLLSGRPSGVTALGILFAVLSGHAMLVRPFRA
jgi:hypothetical protein